MEFIPINPIEELLKALEIVRGPELANMYRRIWWAVQDKHKLDAVEWD